MGRANHFCSRALGRAGQGSDRPQTCGLRARLPDCLSTHRFAGFDGQQSGRECIFPFRTDPQFSMVVPHLRTALACFAHRARASCASSIRNGRLAAPGGLQYSLAHWAYYGLFPPQAAAFVRPSRLQPLRGLRLRTSCARHFSPSGLHLFASICIHSSQSSICTFAPCRF